MQVAGNWILGIVEQSQGEGYYSLQRDGLKGCEGGDYGGKCLLNKAGQPWEQGNNAESHRAGGDITIASVSTHQHQHLNSGEAGPSNT